MFKIKTRKLDMKIGTIPQNRNGWHLWHSFTKALTGIIRVQCLLFKPKKPKKAEKKICVIKIKQEGQEALNRSPEYTGQYSNI